MIIWGYVPSSNMTTANTRNFSQLISHWRQRHHVSDFTVAELAAARLDAR
jgi:hypothetical protein